MTERRVRQSARNLAAPYDVSTHNFDESLPENWTTAKLKEQLTKMKVNYNRGDRRTLLIRKYKTAKSSEPVGYLGSENSVQVPGSSSTDSQMDLSYIAQSISTLTNTVTKLQDELKAVSRQVNRQAPSAAAGREVQLAEQTDQQPTAIVGSNTSNDRLDEGFTLSTAQTPGMSVSQSSTVTRTKFCYAMESLPFIETVSPKLRKAIVEGKDVNLAQLLIPSSNAVNIAEKEHSCGNRDDKYENDPRFHKNLTIAEFIRHL